MQSVQGLLIFANDMFLRLYRRGLACDGCKLAVLTEQVLHKRIESAEYAVALARVLDGHDALAQNVARTQVELATSLVAEVHKSLG